MRCTHRIESWPLAQAFAISRGTKTVAEVVVVELHQSGVVGRGECVPYRRYGETPASVAGQIAGIAGVLADLEPTSQLQRELLRLLPAGAARNAVDCALWDLRARLEGCRVWQLAELPEPVPQTLSVTVGMVELAGVDALLTDIPDGALVKIKLGDAQDDARVARVRAALAGARLIVDANEGWSEQQLGERMQALRDAGVALVEQPLAVGHDAALHHRDRALAVCADESCHVAEHVAGLADRYDVVNVKLDKCGGLTAALDLVAAARAHDLSIMVGCMVCTSLSIAPAHLLCGDAEWVDLDGAEFLTADRPHGAPSWRISDGPCPRALWG